jgi:hypothetical protein
VPGSHFPRLAHFRFLFANLHLCKVNGGGQHMT